MSASSSGANLTAPTPVILAQRYRLDRKLAQGGMAEVWVATDLSLTRQVAVKVLKPLLASDPVVAERFRREAIAVAQLSHPNIVAIYDTIDGQLEGETRQAVVMQLINGKSLRQLLDEQKRLSPDLTMHIGACVAAALDCAHQANLVHRDVKPGNILVTHDGRVLLTDFGIAKGLGDSDDDLTNPNVMMGTAKYLSPEQVRGRKLDGRADLYSLGLVLYECLAGRVPFQGETDADTALARLNRDPTDLTRLRPTLPAGLAPLIHRLLARRPSDRHATGAEVRNELQHIAALPRVEYSNDTPTSLSNTNGRNTPTNRVQRTALPGERTSPVSPTNRAGRPAGAPVRSDRTPPAERRPQARPNRKNQHRATPSLVIMGALLLTAFVVGTVLWLTMGTSTDSGPTVTTGAAIDTALPNGSTGTPIPAAQLQVRTFDPDGDGVENDDLVALAHDGNLSSAWTTVCYDSQYLGGKRGTGLMLDLVTARSGVFSVAVGSAPYQVAVYGMPDGAIPATFDQWGSAVEKFDGREPTTLSVTFASPVRYVLVTFNELAPDGGCSSNRYRGAIYELGFT